MHRHLLTACAAALMAITLQGCDGGGNEADANAAAPAAAAEGDLTQDFTRAADALQAKLGAPGENPAMPPADDPAVDAFDAQAERALAALGTPQLPVDGFETFDAFCAKTAGIVGAYISAGAGPSGPNQEQMLANTERYLDQMFTPLLFAAHCSAQHMPFLEKTASTDDITGKETALQQIRQGAFSQAAGMIEMAAAPDLEPERRARILDLLAQDAEEFAIALSQEQRQQLVDMAGQLKGQLPPEAAGRVDAIQADFQKPECGKLCSL